MNILFICYGDFASNSLNHIAGFAQVFTAAGHDCIVAVPDNKASICALDAPAFTPALHAEVIERPAFFRDGRPADILHAWTPREPVRRCVLAYQARLKTPARLIVHLEDNERHILESHGGGLTFEQLRAAPWPVYAPLLTAGLIHPLRHELLLNVADGVTHIIDRLAEFVPPQTPRLLLWPGTDLNAYAVPSSLSLVSRRDRLGIPAGTRVIVYNGGANPTNAAELRDLYTVVVLLNQTGTPTVLLRTGLSPAWFNESLSADQRAIADDALGFVRQSEIPALLALADVCVQPGRPGPFNDYRLPSKIPEFLAAGRPVVIPPTNIGLHLGDTVLYHDGSPEDMAAACRRIFNDPALAGRLSRDARAFAQRHFALQPQGERLLAHYHAVLASPAACNWRRLSKERPADDTVLFPLRRKLHPQQKARVEECLRLLALQPGPEGKRRSLRSRLYHAWRRWTS